MNGFELAGRKLRVGRATGSGRVSIFIFYVNLASDAPAVPLNIQSIVENMQTLLAMRTKGITEESLSNEENLTISSDQRVQLMQKLSRDETRPKVSSFVLCL